MNLRSFRVRLIGWFAGLLILLVLAFGAYTYVSLEQFLKDVLLKAMERRSEQVIVLVESIPEKGEETVAADIEARFTPGRNDRFMRITRENGSVFYLSNPPTDHSFDPQAIPPGPNVAGVRREPAPNSGDLLIVTTFAGKSPNRCKIEVGGSLAPSQRELHVLLTSLAAGLPILALLAIIGGFLLIKRSLEPVAEITRAAEDISLHHLDRRLPVSPSGDEFNALSLALNRMIARLDESFQHVSRFTADASHELRTPLTIMRGELETLLLHPEPPADSRESLSSMLEEVERLSAIVERLLALSRLDAGEAQSECVRFDLAQLAATTAEQMCLLAEEKKIKLDCKTREPVEIEGDRARLKQVIVNLLDNAIKYTPTGGSVSVAVAAQNNAALLQVVDTGPGIPPGDVPHLFKRFYRADQARSRTVNGAGLGLAIVQSICAAHGGSVAIENAQPSGCVVSVKLPRAA